MRSFAHHTGSEDARGCVAAQPDACRTLAARARGEGEIQPPGRTPALVQDPDRLSRFDREAKLLASLNHPNIATVYGLEEVDGRNYLTFALISF